MKFKKLLFGGLIVATMAMGMITFKGAIEKASPLQTRATGPDPSTISVSGHSVTDGDYYDNDGNPSDSTDYNFQYSSSTGVLKLRNFEGSHISCSSSTEPLKIELAGTNTISSINDSGDKTLIYSNQSVVIGGDGKLFLEISREETSSDRLTGILSDFGAITIGENAEVSVDLRSSKGIQKCIYPRNGFTLTGAASLTLDFGSIPDFINYGIYTDCGRILFESSGATNILAGATNANMTDCIIYNRGNFDVANNGDIKFSGSGPVRITNQGSGSVDAIVSHNGDNDQEGLISFDGANVDVSIRCCDHAVWNRSQARAVDSYDILLNGGAKLNVESSYHSANGLVSSRNGILINGSDYSYKGNGHPFRLDDYRTYSNSSTYGFDVSGESHVNLVVSEDSFLMAKSYQVCDFDLSGSGYFDYRADNGKTPESSNDNFWVKLASTTRLVHELYFNQSEPNSEGAVHISKKYTNVYVPYRLEPFAVPDSPTVTVNGSVSLTALAPYYHGDSNEANNVAEGYNAYYESETGTLYLKYYEGKSIYLSNTNPSLFKIVLEGDSTITWDADQSYARGLNVGGYANLEVTSNGVNPHSLVINVSNAGGYCAGIGTTNGNIRFTGYTDLYINASITTEEEDKNVKGIESNYQGYGTGNISFEGNSYAYIEVAAKKSQLNTSCVCANNGKIIFDTDNKSQLTFDANYNAVESGYSNGLYSSRGIEFKRCSEMLIRWAEQGYYGGPTDPASAFNIVNGAINRDNSTKTLTLKTGPHGHLDIVNGHCNAAQGNYLNEEVAHLYADDIDDLEFLSWVIESGSGSFVDDTQDLSYNATFSVDGDATIVATYDFVDKAPFFDSRGSTENGIIKYKLRGTPDLVQIVSEDHSSVIYSSNYPSGTVVTPGILPAENYCLRAKYGSHYLYSDPFEVNYSSPAHEYTLTFQSGEGSGSDVVVKHTYGDYSLPTFASTGFIPVEGYRFTSWYCNGEYYEGEPWCVLDDYTFTAQYELIPTYNMSFVGGTGVTGGTMSDQPKLEGDNYVLPTPTFDHSAHMEFDYWDVGGDHLQPGAEVLVTGNMTATAYYKYLAQKTLTFSAGEGSESMEAQVKYIDDNFVLPECGFTAPEHKHFSYWDVGGEAKAVGDEIPAAADCKATAIYEWDTHTVTFDGNGGSGSMGSKNYSYGTILTLPACGFTAPAHKQFKCWSIGGIEYSAGASYTITGDTTISAVYENIVRTITFSAGDGSGTMANDTCVDGQEYTLPASTFTAPAHEQFKCWRIGENEYGAGTKVTINADTNIVAVYEDIMVNVSFVAGDGSGTMASVPVKEGSSYVLPECTFTAPEGKVFDGWMIGETKHAAGESVVIDSATTVTAVYKDAPAEPVTPDTPESGAKKGLSGGAIAGIVVGSVVVAGVGGFALTWFVIMKKSWAALVEVFKKIPNIFKKK